ncbi:MAG: PcfJ domain-containing protein [Motiliproteus sp.]
MLGACNENGLDQSSIQWDQDAQCLILCWQPGKGSGSVTRVYGWQQGLSCTIEDEDGVFNLPVYQDPGIDLLSSIHHPEVAQWLATIPEEVRLQLDRFGTHKFFLARLATTESGLHLLMNNPVLLLLWGTYCGINGQDEDSLYEALKDKQSAILQRMDLYPGRAAARLLRRIDLSENKPLRLDYLYTVWADEKLVSSLYHQQHITQARLANLLNWRWSIGFPLFHLLAATTADQKSLIDDTLRMANAEAVPLLRHCRNWDHVHRVHDRFVGAVNTGMLRQKLLLDDDGQIVPFPAPPLEGSRLIVPVTSVEQLEAVGRAMDHCVFAYASAIQAGRYYVYQYEGREHLTVGVVVNNGKVIKVDQIKGRFNREPTVVNVNYIERWVSGDFVGELPARGANSENIDPFLCL